jgi:hypothetical protein
VNSTHSDAVAGKEPDNWRRIVSHQLLNPCACGVHVGAEV